MFFEKVKDFLSFPTKRICIPTYLDSDTVGII